MKKIFVGNLDFSATEDQIRTAFEAFGAVERVSVITDRDTGRSRGFAFVEMTDSGEADRAITGLNGTTSGTSADSGVAVMNAPAGDADGLEEAGDLVRVVTAPHHPHLLWVHEHLQHLSSHIRAIAEPASRVAEQRRLPWWR